VSKTQTVQYGDRVFWAYDVALGILLKHMIDEAELRVAEPDGSWLTESISWWRVVAGVGVYGLEIDTTWAPERLAVFIDLVNKACQKIAKRESIPGREITTWPIKDDMRLHPRGATEIATAPIVELGEAIVALIRGSLPKAPKGTWWFYGTPGGRTTIRM
jgi:hypothetical protein